MHCKNCGHENPAGSKFCEECGSSLELAELQISLDKKVETIKNTKKPSKLNGKLICPVCDRENGVRKLSIVYENGIQITQSSGPRIGIGLTSDKKIGVGVGLASDSGVSISASSAKLAPPEAPSKGCFNVVAWITILFAAGIIIMSFIGYSAGESGIGNQVLIRGVGTLVVGLLIRFFVNQSYSSKYDDYLKKLGLWNMLYICGYDETVFVPKTNFSMNANKLQEFFEKPLPDLGELNKEQG